MNRFAKPVQVASFVVALFAVASSAHLAHAQQKDAPYEKVVTIEGITEYRFPNGLRFLSYPDPSSPTVTVNMTVLVGSRHEGYGETGMAHLLEHMLFKGSKLYPTYEDWNKAIQAHGAVDLNGTTWTDRTNYYETLPASEKNLDYAVRMEADRLVNCFIRREDLAKEMTVVRNEFERGENSPENILSQRLYAIAFEWHNYGKSTIGNRADIERVPIDRLQAFYKKYYQVDNCVLVIAGKFDEKKALTLVSETFGKLKAPNRVLEATYTEEPPQDGEREVILRRVGKVPVVGLLYHIPAASDPDHPAVEILGMILGESPSGRLYQSLVEKKKKATKILYDTTTWHDPGALEFNAIASDGASPEEVRELVIAEVEGFAKNPATQDEVKRAVRKYLSAREQALTKSISTATELTNWVGAGDWRLLFIHRDRVAKVTPADVNRVAGKYALRSNRTSGMFIPTTAPKRATVPPVPDIAKLVEGYKGGKAVVAGEAFDTAPESIEKRVKRFKLSTGIQVAFLPKKTRGDTVTGTLALHFGTEKSLFGKTTPSLYVGSMMMRGTQNKTRAAIQDQLDILQSQLSVSTSPGGLSASWHTKRDKLPELLKLLHEVLREPTFPAAELEILKANAKQKIEKAMVDPQGLAVQALRRKLNPFPETSIHYVPTYPEGLARIAKMKRADVVNIYEQIGGTVGEIAIVGDFDADATVKQLEAIFAGWKASVPYVRIPSVLAENVKGSVESINTPDKKNALFLAAMKFPLNDMAPDYPALEIGNYILGTGFTSRLMDRLREKEGWCYGAGSQLNVESQDKVSQFLIYATCNPNVINKVDKGAMEELNKILKTGITEAELKLATNAYLQEMKVARGKDGSLASSLREGLYLGRTFAFEAELEKRIAALITSDVNHALAAHISSGKLVIIRAGDFNKMK